MANREMMSKNEITLIYRWQAENFRHFRLEHPAEKTFLERGIPGVIGALGGENEGGNP